MDVTFASLVTPAGVVIAAGIITGLIQLVKASIPAIDAAVSGAAMAFVVSAALYVIVAVTLNGDGTITNANGYLGVFLAWLSAATSAVGIKSTFDHVSSPNG